MPHPLRTLVRSRVCHIEHCTGCDILHLSFGPITLRLEIAATRQLVAALGEALARLDSQTEAPPAPRRNAVLTN